MKRTSRLLGAISFVALASSMLPAQVSAAESAEGVKDEAIADIIVTARKKSEVLQDIPLAIRVYDSAMIRREGIARIEDIARKTPGLTFDIGGFPNDTRPALRGMQAERGRPSVAVLIDGQDLSGENLSIAGGSASLNTALFDLERIEVVKGPQSALYGRNAFAGAINYVSKAPNGEFSGRVAGELGTGDLKVLQGAVNVPLIGDKLAVRVNGAVRDSNGYYTNPVNGGQLGAENSKGVGIAALIAPISSVRIVARYQHSKDRMSDSATAFIGSNVRLPAPGANFAAAPGAPATIPCPASIAALTPAQQVNCTRGTVVGSLSANESNIQMGNNPINGRPPFGMQITQNLASVDASWTGDIGTISYRFGSLRNTSAIEQDGDFSNFAAGPGLVLSLQVLQQLRYRNKHSDHELRYEGEFSNVSLTLGAQYFREDSNLINSSQFWLRSATSPLAGPPFRLATAPLAVPTFPVLNSRNTEYYGVFGGVGWQVTDKLKLSAEARWNKDTIDYGSNGIRRQDVSLSQLVPQCLPAFANGAVFSPTSPATTPPPGIVVACPRTASVDYKKVTPRGTIEYKATDDVLAYVSVSKGFKPGGFNTNEVAEFTGQGYQPESVIAYEAGVKTSWLDRRLVLNADVYYNDYTDQQIGVQNTNVAPSGQVITTAGIVNAGKVKVLGFEADLNYRATENLSLMLGYAYTDSEFKEYIQGPPPGSAAAAFTACGVPAGQTSSDQNRAESGNACGNFTGKKVGKSPKHSLTSSVEWRQSFGPGNDSWFLEANGLYRSKRFTDESNLAYLRGYARFGVKAGADFGRMSLTGYVDNLFDSTRIESAQRVVDFGRPEGFAPGRGIIAYLPKPRTIGLRGEVRF